MGLIYVGEDKSCSFSQLEILLKWVWSDLDKIPRWGGKNLKFQSWICTSFQWASELTSPSLFSTACFFSDCFYSTTPEVSFYCREHESLLSSHKQTLNLIPDWQFKSEMMSYALNWLVSFKHTHTDNIESKLTEEYL